MMGYELDMNRLLLVALLSLFGLHQDCRVALGQEIKPRAAGLGIGIHQSKAAIQKVLEDQDVAWNKGDLEGFMAGYWKSPELSFSSGKDRTRGWEATYERYRKRYQAEGREMGKLTFSELEIEMLSPSSAFVRGRWNLVTTKEKIGGLFTLIFKKFPEGWRIIHDHTSGG